MCQNLFLFKRFGIDLDFNLFTFEKQDKKGLAHEKGSQPQQSHTKGSDQL